MVVCGVPGADAAERASGSELVVRALPATADGSLDAGAAEAVLAGIERFRSVALGPGLGRADGTVAAVRRLVAECPRAIVVDADALNALAAEPEALLARRAAGFPPAILTPHAGEYARLAGADLGPDRVAAARDLAARLQSVVLLKGPGTVVAGSRRQRGGEPHRRTGAGRGGYRRRAHRDHRRAAGGRGLALRRRRDGRLRARPGGRWPPEPATSSSQPT